MKPTSIHTDRMRVSLWWEVELESHIIPMIAALKNDTYYVLYGKVYHDLHMGLVETNMISNSKDKVLVTISEFTFWSEMVKQLSIDQARGFDSNHRMLRIKFGTVISLRDRMGLIKT